jgi:hypothetical protein
MTPVSCLIWASRRSTRTIRSEPEGGPARSGGWPAAGCAARSPPNRSLPPNILSNKPSCARALSSAGHAAAIASKAMADAVVARDLTRADVKRILDIFVRLEAVDTIRIPASKL